MAGTIEKGKKADTVLIDLTRIREPLLYPGHNMIDTLIYRGKGPDVDTIIVGGEVLIKDRKFPKIDKEEIMRKLQESIPSDYLEEVMRMCKREMLDELKKLVTRYFEGWYEGLDLRETPRIIS